jgi:hypothetical protein
MLMEILSVLAFASIFALIASQLFTQSMRVITSAPDEEGSIHRWESACQTLRRDAWNGTGFSMGNPTDVQIQSKGQAAIDWQITPEGDLLRRQGDTLSRWPGMGRDLAIQIDGPAIVLRSNAHVLVGNVRCISLPQLTQMKGDSR